MEKIDLNPKPLEQIPIKPIKGKELEITKSDVKKPEISWNWSDTGNLIKKLIGDLTLMVYNGKFGLTFYATIIVVILFLLFKIFKIF